MIVGVLRLKLFIEDNHSLKGKRSVLKRVQETIRDKFGATVAEVADHDLWQSAELGIAMIGTDEGRVNASLDHIINHVENLHLAEVVDQAIELIHMTEDLR